jgi:hypothetical protein
MAMPCTPGVGNPSDDLVGSGVDDDHFSAVAQVEAFGGAVDGQIVEAPSPPT